MLLVLKQQAHHAVVQVAVQAKQKKKQNIEIINLIKTSIEMNKKEIENKIRKILIDHEYAWGYDDNIVEEIINVLNQKNE